MVSYGDSEFVNWATENGFDDNDLALIGKTVTKRKWIWLLLYFLGCGGGAAIISTLVPTLSENAQSIISAIFSLLGICLFFTLPFYVECAALSKFVKSGSFNAKPGIIASILCLVMYISFITIIPIIFWQGAKKKFWGTGIRKLIKKGLVGGH